MLYSSLIPRLPRNGTQICIRGESLVYFLHNHDVIKIRPEQKSNFLCIAKPTMRSTLGVCDIRPQIRVVCFPLPSLFFSVLNLWVCPCTIKVSLPPLYHWHFSRDKHHQALHACTTSMFAFRSVGAWEQGYQNI